MFHPALLKSYLSYLDSDHRFVIGYSGGLDSHVLLHALTTICTEQQRQQLLAIHINHSLSPDATQWSEHCITVCNSLGVACEIGIINANAPTKKGIEATARTLRYEALSQHLSPGDYLLTAHQQDDQAETLLLQLLRGAGIKGLAAMPELTAFAQGYHLRPLLNFTRQELETYAQLQQLQWIEDESNLDTRFDRNYLRQTLMPQIKQRWPAVNRTLSRTAAHCANAQLLLDQIADNSLEKAQGSAPNTLSLRYLQSLDETQCQNVLRRWLQQLALPLPSQIKLQQVQQEILKCQADKNPHVQWGKVSLRRYRDNLYALPSISTIATHTQSWDLSTPLQLPGIGALTATPVIGQGIRADFFADNQATIAFRQTGERCQPAGRPGSHPLKKLFQEWGVPPWQRAKIPLLYCKTELAAVIGHCICEPFIAQKDQPGWLISLDPS